MAQAKKTQRIGLSEVKVEMPRLFHSFVLGAMPLLSMKKFCVTMLLAMGQLSLIAQPVTAYILMIHGPSCNNQSGMLVAQGVGGDGAYTFLWDDGSTNDTISGLGAGTHTVSVFSNGQSDEATVTLPPFGIGEVDVYNACNGNPGLIYLDNINAAYPLSISWTDCSGSPLNETDAQLSNIGAGCYSYSVTDADGCLLSGSVNIYASSPVLEAFVSDSVLCYGQSAYIWYTPGFTLYDNWGGTYNSTTDTILYFNQMGSVNSFPQIGVDSLGCEAQMENNNIFVYQQGHPDAVPLYHYTDTISVSFTIDPDPSTTNTYIWSFNGQIIDTTLYSYLPIDTSGWYGVSIINQYGCSNFGSIQGFVSGVSVDEISGPDVRIIGNPAQSASAWILEIETDRTTICRLMDTSGRIIESRKINAGRHALGLGLPSGLYLLQVGDRVFRLARN